MGFFSLKSDDLLKRLPPSRLSAPGFCLLDLTEQFSLPETSPPVLARLLGAIERKGEPDQRNPAAVAPAGPRGAVNNEVPPGSLSGLENPTLYRTFTAGGGLEVRQYFECGK